MLLSNTNIRTIVISINMGAKGNDPFWKTCLIDGLADDADRVRLASKPPRSVSVVDSKMTQGIKALDLEDKPGEPNLFLWVVGLLC